MTEKIIIVDAGYGETKITTVDGAKRNLVKNYEVDEHSFREIAARIYKRFEKESYDRVIVDAYGVGMGLIDQLIPLFEKGEYNYDTKTGKVTKKADGVRLGTSSGHLYINGDAQYANIRAADFGKEEF